MVYRVPAGKCALQARKPALDKRTVAPAVASRWFDHGPRWIALRADRGASAPADTDDRGRNEARDHPFGPAPTPLAVIALALPDMRCQHTLGRAERRRCDLR